ncbi:MAG: DUF4113 domain-containing protein, partial [Natronospirillum sp.]|uniref:DinB/UmuC family translesion DNA polymerase n=1 Tax=Natronospirillum sp. TaxID=2812955 RepID=UPI0025F2EF8D
HEAPAKQQIVCSRSFGAPVTEKSVMQEAVASYLSRAMEKLRREQRLVRSLQVFIRTSPFREQDPQYSNAATGQLHEPSEDTRPMMGMAMRLLDSIWRDGYPYSKAGVMLSDFYEPNAWQPDLLSDQNASAKGRVTSVDNPQLMQVLDTINAGNLGKIWFARQGAHRDWQMKREWLSPGYLSRWAELPKVR